MKQDLADITVILDRSGSMQSCREEAENGLNHFVEEQKNQPGDAVFTLCQFDTEYEFVHRAAPIQSIPKFTLVPRGMTALLDAVGRAINETGERLSKMPEEERPGLVIFVILTDGLENSSHEFKKDQIKAMIHDQQEKYAWKFTFLGANQDAFAEAAGLGISQQATVSFDVTKSQAVFTAASASITRSRHSLSKGVDTRSIDLNYSDEERKKAK